MMLSDTHMNPIPVEEMNDEQLIHKQILFLVICTVLNLIHLNMHSDACIPVAPS